MLDQATRLDVHLQISNFKMRQIDFVFLLHTLDVHGTMYQEYKNVQLEYTSSLTVLYVKKRSVCFYINQ